MTAICSRAGSKLRIAVLASMCWILLAPGDARASFCRYPPTHLSGVAEVGGSRFIRLDIDVRFRGPDCEVDIIRGRGRCRPVSHRTLGVTFTLAGKCPADTFVISNPSYVPRRGEQIADVDLDIEFHNGDRCHITGTSPALYFNTSRAFGGPLPSLSGAIVCPTNLGNPGVTEFVRR